ncbi:molybdopterin molybdotransferase MoeA [Campylobacter sp. VicNov18]|uniref:molybdopterin molybdotransferase MoeA n=1 Tax=Campylobacter bilis TaxID=2691918 RepID=UPI00130DE3D2|nr:molybdopterin molybdotransferase MoeA [Campylobacter bilis]MPV63538.1 molybdopterin molybdenumtransferase MoeA [Campylobacter hepaticus]MBM0637038.1 molybdopterin molybdenumtransferase MoeA [Campylobacter bilis]MCC8277805.1 molybdopterin molybdotransferase MoeA [Campylobacter bilis]MCC8299414.1 molybdopterin molybdotransferase MoeA [Campylobacter bilis]MCC8300714.1 molybdopterin molybdotransferase MoeA [Campylobacter bilis]
MKNIFQTLKDLENQISSLNESEFITLEEAKDRVLIKDLYAKKNLPSFDNAALDGYAFNYADLNAPLTIKGVIFAGDKKFYEIKKNECYKIMTGAIMPKNADTILMLEDECIQNNKLIIKKIPKQYNAYRYKGEEVKQNELLLKKGTKLNEKHIALLAAQGIYKIEVLRKIRIGIFSSGNELKEPWQECDEKSIYNANALPLINMFKNAAYLGIIKDDFLSTKKALEQADFDLVLTSGGASIGEADFMEKALKELGFTALFKGLKARPTRPTKLYQKDKKIVLILPGNPMAAYLACFIFAKKIIALLSGNLENPLNFYAKMGKDLKLKKGRNNLILGNLKKDVFIPFNDNNFGSGMIIPLIRSEFLLISDEDTGELKQGDEIRLLKI